jgi:hypothetical protein
MRWRESGENVRIFIKLDKADYRKKMNHLDVDVEADIQAVVAGERLAILMAA